MNNSIIVKGDILMKKYINDLILSLQKVGSKKEASMIKVLAQGYEALPGGLELNEELEWEYPDQEGIYDADSKTYMENGDDSHDSKFYRHPLPASIPSFNMYLIDRGMPEAMYDSPVSMDVISQNIITNEFFLNNVSDVPKEDRWVKDHKRDLGNVIKGYVVIIEDDGSEKKLFNFSNTEKKKKETHLPGHRIEEDRVTYDSSINIRGVGEFTGMNELDDFTDEDFLLSIITTKFNSPESDNNEYDPDYDSDDYDSREIPIGIDIDNAIGGEYYVEDDEDFDI